jgi:hypothetical protein
MTATKTITLLRADRRRDRMTSWMDMNNQKDENGNLTPLAVALRALEDNGCSCEEDGPCNDTCLTSLCEKALKSLWHTLNITEHDLLLEIDELKLTIDSMKRDHAEEMTRQTDE